ncbi:MAG: nitroreductase [Paludibacteraceae bacterium]|nr:nitroreductase [Paludibacteraceae bacterium]
MTLQEAIVARHSVRQYLDKPIEAEKIAQLQALIDEYNSLAGLHMQLVTNEPNAFAGGRAKYGKFSGVSNYIAMICPKSKDTLLGYYGERIVLEAQRMGLNTCWVALTFNNQPDQYVIGKGESLNTLISLGYGATQGSQHPQKRQFDEVAKDQRSVKGELPEWFVKGVEAALLGPSALHQQKFAFVLHDNNVVEPKIPFTLLPQSTPTDLGIAMCHFEIAAGKENFEWK